MHPEVTSKEAGHCPKCGMALLPQREESASSYACPMHPEVTSEEAGTCPKCGMALVPKDEESASSYACPMHPEVTSEEAGHCPKCGMALLPQREESASSYACPMHPEVTSEEAGTCPKCGMALVRVSEDASTQGTQEHASHGHDQPTEQREGHSSDSHAHDSADDIEWEDDMVEINRLTTPSNMRWKLVDKATGAENAAIEWRFKVGDAVQIRLLNEMAGDHPMHHPFHVHGAGRFLVLSRDGIPEPNLVWKDTVLVKTGETVDILLDVSNPGRWMAHCHIAEHHETGMMFSFDVDAA